MKTETLVDAIGRIDAAYVEEAELWRRKRSRKSAWHFGLAAAACLLLVLGGTFAALKGHDPDGTLAGGGENVAAGGMEGGAGENGGMESGAEENGGMESEAGEKEGAGNETEHRFEIPREITEVIATYQSGGIESTFTVEGTALIELREWADGLILGEEVVFAAGEDPEDLTGAYFKDSDGEVFTFQFEGQEVSYYSYEACYLVMEDVWYPVLNPTDPPGAYPAGIMVN